MDLYVVRHAIAEERREGLADADRDLTEEGEARFACCVRGLDALGVRVERVLTSPWKRAARTAALLAPIADVVPEREEGLCDAPGLPLLLAIERAAAGAVAVVGHEPWLSELVSWLVTGEATDGDARFRMKKGGVAHRRGNPAPGEMQLRALLPPKVLAALAAGCER